MTCCTAEFMKCFFFTTPQTPQTPLATPQFPEFTSHTYRLVNNLKCKKPKYYTAYNDHMFEFG